MSIFDISLNNDIDFLIKEIGHNIKVNNIDSKAIVNNVGNETDDKKIITKSELQRGDYINYNNLYFLVMDEINDKRYNVYNKATIRSCNFNIKFIIEDKLYLFPSIINGDKFFIQDNNIMPLSADAITVTLPVTDVTKQIKVQDCFLKWGQKWEVQGINNTKDGLIILNCKTIGTSHLDDKENEIADRWTEDAGVKKDRLNGNVIPIMPFDTNEESYTDAMVTFICKNIETEENIADVIVKLTDKNENEMYIIANQSYQIPKGIYTYTIEKEGYEIISGEIDIQRDTIETILLTVKEEEPTQNITYTITAQMPYPDIPDDEIWLDDPPAIYTVHKFVDGVETSGKFTFEVTDTTIATITETTDNTVSIIANDFVGKKNIILIATDTDTGQVAIEKEINIVGR